MNRDRNINIDFLQQRGGYGKFTVKVAVVLGGILFLSLGIFHVIRGPLTVHRDDGGSETMSEPISKKEKKEEASQPAERGESEAKDKNNRGESAKDAGKDQETEEPRKEEKRTTKATELEQTETEEAIRIEHYQDKTDLINDLLGGRVAKKETTEASSLESGAEATVYTEMFTGTGWKDGDKSDVYHDEKSGMISFPPTYELSRMSEAGSALEGAEIKEAGSNERVVLLISADGKIFYFGKEGDMDVHDTGIDMNGKQPVLDYDRSRERWILAAADTEGVELLSFQVSEEGVIEENSFGDSPAGLSGLREGVDNVNLSCLEGECLLRAGNGFYTFLVDRPAEFKAVDLWNDKEDPVSFSLGKSNGYWLLGAVRSREDRYHGDIYLLSPPASEADLAAADCHITPEKKKEYVDALGEMAFVESDSDGICRTIKPAFISDYPGKIIFEQSNGTGDSLFVLYNGYQGQGYDLKTRKAGVDPAAENYSDYFYERLGKFHKMEKVFRSGDNLWITSEAGGGEPEFKDRLEKGWVEEYGMAMRINNGINTVLSRELMGANSGELLRGQEESSLYALRSGEDPLWKYLDRGVDTEKNKLAWVSTGLAGSEEKRVVGAEIISDTGGVGQGEIEYYFSRDGGDNWISATEGEVADLTDQVTDGVDTFRWKAVLEMDDTDEHSPWLSLVQIRYYIK